MSLLMSDNEVDLLVNEFITEIKKQTGRDYNQWVSVHKASWILKRILKYKYQKPKPIT